MTAIGYGVRRTFQKLKIITYPATTTTTVSQTPITVPGKLDFSLTAQSALIALLEDI